MQSDNIGAAGAARTQPMSQLPDFNVAAGSPDVRGWTVVAPDGSRLGTVRELMVDTAAMRVASLDVELAAGDQRGRTTLPVESVQVDGAHRVVVVTASSATGSAPATVRAADAASTDVKVTDEEVRVPIVEEELVVERRPVVKEEIVVRKSAVTREKTVEADLRKERVEIDRTDQNDSR